MTKDKKIVMVEPANKQGSRKKQQGVKTLNVKADNVNVGRTNGSTRRGRKVKRAEKEKLESNIVTQKGLMTRDSHMVAELGLVRDELLDMDKNAVSWLYKYIDPAGSVETGRAIDEFSKVPDGLCTFSVDAEIRVIKPISVPVETPTGPPGELSLDGKVWSLVIISYPMFRTAFIAVGNYNNESMSGAVNNSLATALNNLEDYRAVVDADEWVPFHEPGEGWYYRIVPLPPTYDLPDPVGGPTRTVTAYRLTYKSLTIEDNSPTLLNQGFWNGAQYAISPGMTPIMATETEGVLSPIFFRNYNQNGTQTLVVIRNLQPFNPVEAGVNSRSDSYFAVEIGVGSLQTFNYQVPIGYTWFVSTGGPIFAESGDTVTFTRTPLLMTIASDNTTSPAPIVTPMSTVVLSTGFTYVVLDLPLRTNAGGNNSTIELPATNTEQVAANNPKQVQYLMKESGGAYLVHSKIRNPVFELTDNNQFGPIQFTSPGKDALTNFSDGSGIQDSFDRNLSTSVAVFMGIPHANVPVVKVYQGWEGLTNVNTPFGQFGHSGLARCEHILQMAESMTTRTTGVYPANDNFLGSLSKMAARLLSSTKAVDASAPYLHKLVDLSLIHI